MKISISKSRWQSRYLHLLSFFAKTHSNRTHFQEGWNQKTRNSKKTVHWLRLKIKSQNLERFTVFQRGDSKRLQWCYWPALRPETGLEQLDKLRINYIQKSRDTHMSCSPFSCIYKHLAGISYDVKIKTLDLLSVSIGVLIKRNGYQTVVKAIGPPTESKAPLLKAISTQLIKHGEVKLHVLVSMAQKVTKRETASY